jgi:phytanoyl-CoA hydroxylase
LLTAADVSRFHKNGFVVAEGLATGEICDELQALAVNHLQQNLAPVEYEVDLQYPGSPVHPEALGGTTVRRLLQACARDIAFRKWAAHASVKVCLQQLFELEQIGLSQCHHNCIMTKQPGFSSVTLWHQDNRYWAFDQDNLISVWLALDEENHNNGCLRVIPGSHRLALDPGRFDASLFLRADLAENKSLIKRAERVELKAGDTLFFHSKLFHAAGRNLSDQIKFSVVFTYHDFNNHPIAATRSAQFPSINI